MKHANAEIYCALNDNFIPDGEFSFQRVNGFVVYRPGDEIAKEDETLADEAWSRLESQRAARAKRNAEGALLAQGLTPEAVKNEDQVRMAETVRAVVEAIVPSLIAGTIAALKAEGVIAAPAKPAPKGRAAAKGQEATS